MEWSEAGSGGSSPAGPQRPSARRGQPGPGASIDSPSVYRQKMLAWRDARILCLLLATIAMSLADLAMTLIHATSIGMQEENPIARLLMRYGGICSICIWKAGTVAIGVFILWRVRRTLAAEVGAWLCFFVLAGLSLHWVRYNSTIGTLASEVLTLENTHPTGDWVVMQNEAEPAPQRGPIN